MIFKALGAEELTYKKGREMEGSVCYSRISDTGAYRSGVELVINLKMGSSF